jgi:putative salt-induced outer membrane protein YdiY
MNFSRIVSAFGTLALGTSVLFSPELTAQDERTLGWTDVAELNFVFTSGNASSSTFGLKNTAERVWERSSFKLSAGALRAESGTVVRTATGTVDDFTISKETKTELTAESYFLKGRFDRALSQRSFLYGGADWNRNTFAGIQNRYGLGFGGGRSWFNEDTRRLKTDLGLTYTIQDDVAENPDVEDSFAGIRASYDFFHKLTETTDFSSGLVMDENLNNTDDFRADWTNAISVTMSERLALKTSLQLLFDNHPALTAVPLGDVEVLTPLGKFDSVFSVAIVASF